MSPYTSHNCLLYCYLTLLEAVMNIQWQREAFLFKKVAEGSISRQVQLTGSGKMKENIFTILFLFYEQYIFCSKLVFLVVGMAYLLLCRTAGI